jgi:hypothetical protein
MDDAIAFQKKAGLGDIRRRRPEAELPRDREFIVAR